MTGTIDKAVLDGQAVYNRFVLACYDLAVLHGTAPLWWGCTVGDLLGLYNASVGAEHLEIGVGTGYLPAHCRFPVADPRITLLDLNPAPLAFTARRLRSYRPTTVLANVLEPFPLPANRFDSVALNFLLHCVPGSIPEKAVVLASAARVAKPGGVVFGGTVLSSGVPVPRRARIMLRCFNRLGLFHNDRDDLADLRSELDRRFVGHRIVVRGNTALFRARVGGGQV